MLQTVFETYLCKMKANKKYSFFTLIPTSIELVDWNSTSDLSLFWMHKKGIQIIKAGEDD